MTDATCMVCGCLCDDIVLTIDDDGSWIVAAENACELGRPWFLERPVEDGRRPNCWIDGRPASWREGARRAAEILNAARCPLICGLSGTTSEAQRLAVAIADWSRGCVDLAFDRDAPAAIAYREVGAVTCTLGEVRARADLIVVWGADPVRTHPRHFERYSLFARGEFVSNGRADRHCVVVDVGPTATAQAADEFLCIEPRRHFEALWALRALARGVELDAAFVEAQTGAPLAAWRSVLDRMKHARYGVVLYDEAPAAPSGLSGRPDHHALFALVRELNESTRFVCVPLGRGANHVGAENVLAAATGFPAAASFAHGPPRHGPGEHSAAALLERGEADAVLIVSDWGDASGRLAPAARDHLGRIPHIVIDSTGADVDDRAAVVFHTAAYGIHASGTVYRADGVPLPLRAALPAQRPSDADVLRAIAQHARDRPPAH